MIARWSSDGPNYTSGLAFGVYRFLKGDRGDVLDEAYILACERGLLPRNHPKVERYIVNSGLTLSAALDRPLREPCFL